ncbi:neprilysin-1-like isoform X2 [Penaeus japonicus]|uniref:neprilysin-1-like isoform X2 n=1 Tax=Penaeus japonicus TaxID=27405 RepID=UPI001C713AA2|nr:neprilysin-1-like isoform X2 [Penaeus japonicus]
MELGTGREHLVPETTGGFRMAWRRRTPLEKVLLGVSGVAVLACMALVGTLAVSGSQAPATHSLDGHFSETKEPQIIQMEEKHHARLTADVIHDNFLKFVETHGDKALRLPVYRAYTASGEVEICNTEECVLAAADIIEAMDTSADPCDDFYQFACGGWEEKNPVPEESSRWSQFDLLRRELSNALSVILEEPEAIDDPSPLKKAKAMFSACMNTTALEEASLIHLTDFLSLYGGWPMASLEWTEENFDWQFAVADARKVLGSAYLVSVWVFADQKDTDTTALYIDQTSLGLPRSVLVNPSNYEERINAYKAYMAETTAIVASHLGQSISSEDIQSDVNAVFDFEMLLANITTPDEDRRDINRMYNPMTVAELSELTPGASLNWQQLLSNMFALAGNPIESTTRVIVQELEYMKKMAALVDTTNQRTLANYIMWRHVKALGDETNQEMRDASFKYAMVANGVTAPEPRWKECADKTNDFLGIALGTKYVETYFSQQAKDEANEMVEDIRSAFKDLLEVNDWMDEETKPQAVEKANAISKFIAYPDWYGNTSALEHFYDNLGDVYRDRHFGNVLSLSSWWSTDELDDFGLPTERSKWFSAPTIVNAFYMPEFNSITFPAGILQPPFYRANSLQALNYGGIGQVIGHEITHGFDDQGRQNDKNGNAIPWWTNATLEAFKVKAQCIVDQYDNIRVPEIDEFMPNATLNGVNTQGENIADNGGLREAFLAYQKYIDRNGEEPRLPGLDQYSPEQLFFLSNANIWCGSITMEGLLNQVLTDPHSPGKFRVLVPMKNMEEFSTVWSCPAGSGMNPEKKCVVW